MLKNMLKTIFQFVVYSSKDPSKISLTLKGFAGVVGTIVVTIAAVFGFEAIPATEISNFFKDTVDAVLTIIGSISALVTIYGGVRKLFRTATGDNKAI